MEKTTIEQPGVRVPAKDASPEILMEADRQTETERQVIVHCTFDPGRYDTPIRIWKSTFLRDRESSHRSRLLHAGNITLYPVWKYIEGGKPARFTLVFSALPKGCTSFDLFEDIPEPGGFYSEPVSRNRSDVYYIEILS